jgi:hypothetical protein
VREEEEVVVVRYLLGLRKDIRVVVVVERIKVRIE